MTRSPEGYERKALGMGISVHGGSAGQRGVGSSTRDFEIWLKGALGMERLSLKTLCGGGLGGGASSLGALEDMLRKSLDMGISLHAGPFPSEGNLVCGGARIPRT